MRVSIDHGPGSATEPAPGAGTEPFSFLTAHRSGLLWTLFVAIAAADVVLPGPSFSVFCLPVFFAILVLVRPRYPWPLASAAACFLVGAWLLEQGLYSGAASESLIDYRIADRLLISLSIVLITSVHSRLHRIHDNVAQLRRQKALGRFDAAGEGDLVTLKRFVMGLSLVTLAIVFAVDAVTPKNWNIGTLYLLPVLWASSLRRPLLLAGLVPVAAGLSVLGYYLGPPSTVVPEPSVVLLERVITIFAVLVSGVVLTVYFARKGRSGNGQPLALTTTL
jgi:hypothetical protein